MTYDGPDRRRRRNKLTRALAEFGREPTGSRWHHLWRDFVPGIAIVIAFAAVVGVEGKIDTASVDARIAKRVAGEQQAGRYRAVYSACVERNKFGASIVTFLAKDLRVSPRTRRKARSRFPQEPDCKAYTKSLLDGKVPPGAFDLPASARRAP
jgi:hypothetical protein